MLAVDILRLINIAGCFPLFVLFALRLRTQKIRRFREHLKGTLFAVAALIIGISSHLFENRQAPFDLPAFIAQCFVFVALVYWTKASVTGWKKESFKEQQRG